MRYFLFSVTLLFFSACDRRGDDDGRINVNVIEHQKKLIDTVDLYLRNEFHFEYDNQDETKFGVKFVEHDLPIGQPSLVLQGDTCYVVDAFHNNVKKIDLISGAIASGAKFPGPRVWLYDIMIFNSKLFVSSELDTIYVFSKNLELLEKRAIMRGRSSFVRKFGDDSLSIFYMDENKSVTLDNNLEVLNVKSISVREVADETYFRNKTIKSLWNGSYQTDYGVLKTEINLFFSDTDFDSLHLVNLKQDSTSLVLSVFDFERSRITD